MKIILGSSSRFRREVFKEIVDEFDCMSPDFDESTIRMEDPKELTIALAHGKADALLDKIHEPALLVTADQVVVLNGNILEKPRSEDEARLFLRETSGVYQEAVNGVVVTNTVTGKRAVGNHITTVHFREIPDEAIEFFIKQGDIMSCGGATKAESLMFAPYVEKIDGTADSLSGVPKDLIKKLLEEVR